MNDLEQRDIDLLQYIYNHPEFDMVISFDKFGLSANARIDNLMLLGYIVDIRDNMPDGDKAKYLGLYQITDKGTAFLEDYKGRKIAEKMNFIASQY